MSGQLPSLVEWFASHGIEFRIREEPDTYVLWVEYDDWTPLVDYADELLDQQTEAVGAYLLEAQMRRKRFHLFGGPFDGQKHGCKIGTPLALSACRGAWHAYGIDRQAIGRYAGKATNEKKAMALASEYLKTNKLYP